MTLRSLVIGLLLAFGVGAVVPFLGLYVQGSNAGAYFTSQIAISVPIDVDPTKCIILASTYRPLG